MQSVLIFGGHGKVALRLAAILSGRGDSVTSVIRNPDQASDVEKAGARPVVHDIQSADQDALAALIRDHDAVVWSAGAGGGSPERTYAIDRDAAIRSMDAAEKIGVMRYVMVSYIGSGPNHGVSKDDPFYAYAQSKTEADAHLEKSALEWTILAPGPLNLGEPTGRIEVENPGDGAVSRGDVAAVAAAALEDDRTIGKRIAFGNGDTPIPEALASL